jgi:hypothetical protein
MYCPRCAVQNVDDARFCRACGADISLVPQALTGQLAAVRDEAVELVEGHASRRRRRKGKEKEKEKEVSVEKGVESFIVGLGFVLVSLSIWMFAPAGRFWFFWLLIPAFFCFAEAVPMIMRARREQNFRLPYAPPSSVIPPPTHFNELPPRDTGEIIRTPSSVTEGTTRHLDAMRDRS